MVCTSYDEEVRDEPQAHEHFRQSSRGSRFGATVKATLDYDLVFVGQPSGPEVEAREVAVGMLELFMTSDRDFRQRQKLGQKNLFESRENRIDKRPQMNGHGAE